VEPIGSKWCAYEAIPTILLVVPRLPVAKPLVEFAVFCKPIATAFCAETVLPPIPIPPCPLTVDPPIDIDSTPDATAF
jgi:hypothetical protein